MEQFSLEKYLENPNRKVVTREGRPVRIVCWDSPNKVFPIVGFIDDNPTVFVWDKYGYALSGHRESNRDLFFADEEEGLTEFEKAVKQVIWTAYNYDDCSNGKDVDDIYNVKATSKTLIDLARKEILKSFPMWKKITEAKQNYLAYGYLSHDGYYLSIQELKDKLPKEE